MSVHTSFERTLVAIQAVQVLVEGCRHFIQVEQDLLRGCELLRRCQVPSFQFSIQFAQLLDGFHKSKVLRHRPEVAQVPAPAALVWQSLSTQRAQDVIAGQDRGCALSEFLVTQSAEEFPVLAVLQFHIPTNPQFAYIPCYWISDFLPYQSCIGRHCFQSETVLPGSVLGLYSSLVPL